MKKTIKYLISAAFAVTLLWFSFRDVEWAGFIEGLKSCRWEFIVLSMAGGAFAFWLRGVRWRQLLLPLDPHTSRITTFNGINIGNISNFVFPRIGEFVRCGVIVRRSQKRAFGYVQEDKDAAGRKTITYEEVLGTVVLERGWELLVMLIMLALVLILGFERFGSFFVEQIWTPLSQKLNMWWVVAAVVAMIAASAALIWKYKTRNAFLGKVAGIFKGLLQGFSSCLRMERKWMFFAYTAFIWLVYWFMAACTVWAAPFLSHLDVVDALFLSLVGGLGFAVPVPGGIGAFHFIIGLTLSTIYDVPMETGIIYATISHTSQAITQILFGAVSYGYETLKK
jgi:uncharacterized membrane protein YbhN (UPF0104 family)